MAEAVADQVRAMPYYSPFTYFGTAPASNLAAKIAEMAPGDLNNVFMSTSGSLMATRGH
jgi:putrescine aminotransferase